MGRLKEVGPGTSWEVLRLFGFQCQSFLERQVCVSAAVCQVMGRYWTFRRKKGQGLKSIAVG